MAKRSRNRRDGGGDPSVALMEPPIKAASKGKVASRSVHVFGETLDIGTVTAERTRLGESLVASGDLELDGSQIERVDAAFLQLLVAVFRQGNETGKTVRWTGASSALKDSARILGLSRAIGLKES